MPRYTAKCTVCDRREEIICSPSNIIYPECCGQTMTRDYKTDLPHTQSDSYRRPIVSDSLAMNPSQIPEHNRMFPDIEVLPDGRPVFDKFSSHEAYLKKTGFVKLPGRQKRTTTP